MKRKSKWTLVAVMVGIGGSIACGSSDTGDGASHLGSGSEPGARDGSVGDSAPDGKAAVTDSGVAPDSGSNAVDSGQGAAPDSGSDAATDSGPVTVVDSGPACGDMGEPPCALGGCNDTWSQIEMGVCAACGEPGTQCCHPYPPESSQAPANCHSVPGYPLTCGPDGCQAGP